jgi:hypothetical protein
MSGQTHDLPSQTTKPPSFPKTIYLLLKRLWQQLTVIAQRLTVMAAKTKCFRPPGRDFGTVQSEGATATKANPAQTNCFPITTVWFADFNGQKVSCWP